MTMGRGRRRSRRINWDRTTRTTRTMRTTVAKDFNACFSTLSYGGAERLLWPMAALVKSLTRRIKLFDSKYRPHTHIKALRHTLAHAPQNNDGHP